MGIEIVNVIQISDTEIAEIKAGIKDECGNGYEVFYYDVNTFSREVRRGERTITRGGKKYYDNGTDKSEEFMLKHCPKLENVYHLAGCDSFGVMVYPIMNGQSFLKGNLDYAIKVLRITPVEARELKKYNDKAYAEFILKLINTRYKEEVDKAIDELEKLSGKKYTRKEIVSPQLYNDIHYRLVTEKDGWNVYKGKADEIKDYPIKLENLEI